MSGVSKSETTELRIHGMDCAEEVGLIRRRLEGEAGIGALTFDVFAGKLIAEHDTRHISREALISAIAETGLRSELWSDGKQSADAPSWQITMRTVLTWTSGISLLAGLIAQGVVSGSVWESLLAHSHEGHVESYAILALFLVSIASGAFFVVPKGLRSIGSLRFDMNALVLISLVGAAVLGEWAEGATLAFLFCLAIKLEQWSMERARREVRELMQVAPPEASVLHEDHEHRVPVERVEVGSIIRVRPGERVPCDGDVVSGSSGVNEAMLTGEPVPIWKHSGDTVFAGTFNGDGTLAIRTTKPAADTRLARIVRMIEESTHRRSASEQFIDKFARYYTPVMLGLAASVCLVPPLVMGAAWTESFYQAMLILLIACPCALVISTPVTIVAALASAARHGVLVKGGAHLEEASRLQAVAFDKTGVLTLGEPEVVGVSVLGGHTVDETVQRLASLEHYSEHALARAIVKHAARRGVRRTAVEDFESKSGIGAAGTVDGRDFWVGNVRMLRDRAGEVPEVEAKLREFDGLGQTVVVCGEGSEPWALVAFADTLREEAPSSLAGLRALGIERMVMLTGDNKATAAQVAQQAGIVEWSAEMLPDDKMRAVEELLAEHKHVAMVGDGVNDAQAIADASLGVAMGGRGTDLALETADIVLMSARLDTLPFLVRHARRAHGVILQNLFIALFLKAVFIGLAFAGLATLWMAVVADVGATMLVVANGLRLLTVREKERPPAEPELDVAPAT